VKVFVNGEEKESASVRAIDGGPASFWRQHPYKGTFNDIKIDIPLEEGTHIIRVQTSENAAGLTGFDEVAITLSKEVKASGGGGGSGTSVINIYMPQEITDTSVDTVQYYLGKRDPLPKDPVFRELPNEPASSVFHGNIEKIDATLTITKFVGLTDKKDTLTAELSYIIEGESIKIFTADFTETKKDSNIFRTEIDLQKSAGITIEEEWIMEKIVNGDGSGEGSYYPYNIRVRGLKSSDAYIFRHEGKNYKMEEHDGWYYLKGKSLAHHCISDHPEFNKTRCVGSDSDGALYVKEDNRKANIKYELVKDDSVIAMKEDSKPYVHIISNFDNSDLEEHSTEFEGFKWPTDNGFDFESDWPYYLKGNKLYLAVNDDYTERQKDASGKWIKDNLMLGNEHHIVENDISLQDGVLIIGKANGTEKAKLKWTNRKEVLIWWKIPGQGHFTVAPDNYELDMKDTDDVIIPLKIEGLSAFDGFVSFSVSWDDMEGAIERKLNLKVFPTFRMVACQGRIKDELNDPIGRMQTFLTKTLAPKIQQVSPKGIFELKTIVASKDNVTECAKNRYPDEDRFPKYWNLLFLYAHGKDPVYVPLDPQSGYVFPEYMSDVEPQDPTEALLTDEAKQTFIQSFLSRPLPQRAPNSLRWRGDKVQQVDTNNLDDLKKAIEIQEKVDALPLLPKYKGYRLLSYLDFENKDDKKRLVFPRQLFSPTVQVLVFSCWDWWYAGPGKASQTGCVTISKLQGKITVNCDGPGSPFELWGHFCNPSINAYIVSKFYERLK